MIGRCSTAAALLGTEPPGGAEPQMDGPEVGLDLQSAHEDAHEPRGPG